MSPLVFEALERRLVMSAGAGAGVDFGTVRFAVIGDYGDDNPAEAAVAAMVFGWQPDFIVTTGDNNYPQGQAETIDRTIGQYYHSYIGDYQGIYGEGSEINRFFPSLGNHDWDVPGATGLARIQPYLDYFTLPGNERYYDLTWGPVHVVVVDSDFREPDGRTATSVQGRWAQRVLEESVQPWQFVFFHEPGYSSGDEAGSLLVMQWPFDEWGADAVFTGHNHTYERLNIGGMPYFVNGLGGRPAYSFRLPPRIDSISRFRGEYGAMLVTADELTARYDFYAVTNGGQLIDSYVSYRVPITEHTLIESESVWRYLDDGRAPATGDWTGLEYSDANWSIDIAPFGFGEDDWESLIEISAGQPTTYFRRTFHLDSTQPYAALNIDLVRDDGAVVYVNGHEVVRTNMPGGAINPQTPAAFEAFAAEYRSVHRFVVDPSFLRPGQNVVAVEIHQNAPNSPDHRFDLAITAVQALDDLTGDLRTDAADLDEMHRAIRTGVRDEAYDLNRDQQINPGDLQHLLDALGSKVGDANLDGAVDIADLRTLASWFGMRPAGWAQGDFNGDQRVDITDLAQLAARFDAAGQGSAATAANHHDRDAPADVLAVIVAPSATTTKPPAAAPGWSHIVDILKD